MLASLLATASPSPSPSPSSSSIVQPVPVPSPEEIARLATQETFWEHLFRWFLGVPLQIVIIIGITAFFVLLLHRLINRTVKRIIRNSEQRRYSSRSSFRRSLRLPLAARRSSATSKSEDSTGQTSSPDADTSDTDEQLDEEAAIVRPASLKLQEQRSAQRANAIGSLLRSSVTVIASSIALLTILPLLNINIAPLLTSAGVLGVALGFGAQNLVKDYLSGMFIVIEDQYGVGDIVEINNIVGEVQEVTLRITQLTDLSGVVWYVRNGEILQVANRSQGSTLAIVDIPVASDTDLDKVRHIVNKVGKESIDDTDLGGKLLEAPYYGGVESVSGEAIVVRILATTLPNAQIPATRMIREKMRNAFTDAGITIPVVLQLPGNGQAGGSTTAGKK